MKLERALPHQKKAVESIVRVLENIDKKYTKNPSSNPVIDLNSLNILKNIEEIQICNNIPKEMRTHTEINNQYLNLDIKMETGTGKTFTQLLAIYELNARYNFNKFIIVVPTLAIKAGTKQFIQSKDTKTLFEDEYNGVEIELKVLEKSNNKKRGKERIPSEIREFVTSPNKNSNKIQVMLINSHLITTGTILTKEYDSTLLDEFSKPSEAIKTTRPILIIDEPHKFEKNNKTFKKMIDIFAPQCIIRFGATFPTTKTGYDYNNLLYNLSSIDAFNNNLIKGVIAEYVPTKTRNNIRIKLISVKSKENCTIHKIEEEKTKSYVLTKGNSLSIIHEDFDGVEITGIGKNSVYLSNGIEIQKGVELSPESYSMSYQDMMIETALTRHFDTEERNFNNKIKTLALFFIDDISSYKAKDNKPAYLLESFDKILKEKLKNKINETDNEEYKEYLKKSLENIPQCRASYFSEDKTNKDEEIQKGIDDILNGKEKILKIYENNGEYNLRRFIFSKWTLKEGWDNPNVFTIAKLRSSGSETSKIQEVGRGLRLPVDTHLNRIDDKEFYLNYIVDFTEKNFINDLKKEVSKEAIVFNKIPKDKIAEIAKIRNIDVDYLYADLMLRKIIDFEGNILDEERLLNEMGELSNKLNPNKIIERKDAEKNKIKIRKEKYAQIKKLWELLNQKYIINYSHIEDNEIESALLSILKLEGINSYDEIITKRQKLDVKENTINIFEENGLSIITNEKYKYNEFLFKLSKATNIPIKNIHNAFVLYNKEHPINDNFFNNTVLTKFIVAINEWKAKELFKRFTYKKINLPIHPTSLTNANGKIKDSIVLGYVGSTKSEASPQEKYLYDTIAYDSEIEKNNIMEEIKEVTVFGKIPRNSILIPLANGGAYSPDFMYLIEKSNGTSELNLIIESKGMETKRALSEIESDKIKCAEKFFETLKEDGINIKFERQLNNNRIGAIIKKLINDNN